jgi:predicted chitinase
MKVYKECPKPFKNGHMTAKRVEGGNIRVHNASSGDTWLFCPNGELRMAGDKNYSARRAANALIEGGY